MAGMSGSTTVCPSPAPSSSPPARYCRVTRALDAGCRYVLATVFLIAAISKITDLNTFSELLLRQSGWPYKVVWAIANLLPWLELTCAACVLFGRAVREAAATILILLVLFTVYSLTHLHEQDCGCYLFPSAAAVQVWWW